VLIIDVVMKYPCTLFLGTFGAMTTFVLFYLFSAYLLSYTVGHMKLLFEKALEMQMAGAVFFTLLIPFAGRF